MKARWNIGERAGRRGEALPGDIDSRSILNGSGEEWYWMSLPLCSLSPVAKSNLGNRSGS